jgi:hypothetical protein
MADEPAVTPYGVRSSAAPEQLSVFSFLVGKWEGVGKTRLPDGSYAEYPVSWIGRYILDGTAIADEAHAPFPDGSPGLGISIRSFDAASGAWTIEFINVSMSFIRSQVNARSGSVRQAGDAIVVLDEHGDKLFREVYRRPSEDVFTYAFETSADGGATWDAGSIEFTLKKVE